MLAQKSASAIQVYGSILLKRSSAGDQMQSVLPISLLCTHLSLWNEILIGFDITSLSNEISSALFLFSSLQSIKASRFKNSYHQQG